MSLNETRHQLARLGIATVAAGLTALTVGAGAASAHISTDPGQIQRAEYNRISFLVPNESPTAGTTKIELTLPTEYPIISVRTEPHPGWTGTINKAKLDKPVHVDNVEVTEAVRTVTWTANPGTRIGPDQFGVFSILTSGLPDNTDTLVIAAAQTYDDGKVVNWNAPPAAAGAEEPEFPAPVVRLTGTTGSHGGHTEATTSANPSAPATHDDSATRWLAGGGLLIATLALGVAIGALLRARRSCGPIAPSNTTE